jgi:GntR family transcriptional regulator, transcriptional repressor for pyruvate dehydrogenase complex
MPTACKLKNALRGVSQMSQVLKGRSGVRYSGGMNTAPEEDEQEAAKADPLARLLQCHPETAFDYLEFRRMMAGPAAAFAAERATSEDIERLGKCLHAMEEAHELDDPSQEAAADASFHLAVYEASHNQVLIRIMQQFIRMMSEDVFYERTSLYQRRGVRDSFLRQHQAIYHAIAAGNPEAARATADAHLASTMEALREAQRADARLEVALRRQQGAKLVTGKVK